MRKSVNVCFVGVSILLLLLLVACGTATSATSVSSEAATAVSQANSATGAAETTVSSETSTTPAAETTTSAAAETTTTAAPASRGDKLGETQSIWNMDITVGVPALDNGEKFTDPTKDMCVVQVQIMNTGTTTRPYDPLFFSAEDSQGNVYPHANATMMLQNVNGLGAGDLAPGHTVGGYIGFQIAKGSSLVSVTLDAGSIGGAGSATWTH